jgi:hypothetical protein
MLRIGWKACPYCGDHEVYRSRREPLTWLDRVCVLFLFQLVRCYECENRHYRPVFFPVPEYYPPELRENLSQSRANHEKHERSA